MSDIEELRRLLVAATPGPWHATEWLVDAEGLNRELAACMDSGKDVENAQLIAALRNNAEALLRDAEERDTLLASLMEASAKLRAVSTFRDWPADTVLGECGVQAITELERAQSAIDGMLANYPDRELVKARHDARMAEKRKRARERLDALVSESRKRGEGQ